MRRVPHILLLLVGSAVLVGVAIAAGAAPAGASDACGPDDLGSVAFSINGAPADELATSAPLVAGDVVAMSWDGTAAGCADLMVSLSAHRVDASPTAEVTDAAACVLAECGESISLVVPDRSVVCLGDVVAATGPPELDRNVYGDREIAAARIDAGDCIGPVPFASVSVLCAQRSVGVSLTNAGDVDAVVTIRIDGQDLRSVEVGSAERLEKFPVAEDTPVSIEVRSADQVVLERLLRPDCFPDPQPPAIESDCAAGGASVVLDNPTPDPIDYIVVVDGTPAVVEVGAFRMEKVNVSLDEDTTSVLKVLGSDAAELVRVEVRRDCERPRASVALDCASGTVAFTLDNDGSMAAMIDLVLDGTVMVSIPVQGGEQVVAHLDVVEDRQVDVAARSGGTDLVAVQLDVDCVPSPAIVTPPATPASPTVAPPKRVTQVQGVSVTRSATLPLTRTGGTLPKTGSDVAGSISFGSLLLALGAACLTMANAVRGRYRHET